MMTLWKGSFNFKSLGPSRPLNCPLQNHFIWSYSKFSRTLGSWKNVRIKVWYSIQVLDNLYSPWQTFQKKFGLCEWVSLWVLNILKEDNFVPKLSIFGLFQNTWVSGTNSNKMKGANCKCPKLLTENFRLIF